MFVESVVDESYLLAGSLIWHYDYDIIMTYYDSMQVSHVNNDWYYYYIQYNVLFILSLLVGSSYVIDTASTNSVYSLVLHGLLALATS